MSEVENVSVRILDRDYKIKCLPEQASELKESALYVDEQMKKARQSTSVNSTERMAILTALNICHELILLKKQKSDYLDAMHERIQALQERIENSLAATDEVAV